MLWRRSRGVEQAKRAMACVRRRVKGRGGEYFDSCLLYILCILDFTERGGERVIIPCNGGWIVLSSTGGMGFFDAWLAGCGRLDSSKARMYWEIFSRNATR